MTGIANTVIAVCNHTLFAVTPSTYSTFANSSIYCPTAYTAVYIPSSGLVYAACSGGPCSICSLNPATGAFASVLNTTACDAITDLKYSEITHRLYASCQSSGVLTVDPVTGHATTLLAPAQCPSASGIGISPITGVVYAACFQTSITAITETSAGVLLTTIGTGVDCKGLQYSPVASSINSVNLAPQVFAPCTNGVVMYDISCGHLPGTFASAAKCIQCSAGKFRTRNATSYDPVCQPCLSGTVSGTPGAGQCTACDQG